MNINLEIIFYSQKGEGVGFYNEKPVYIKGVIKKEIVEAFIYLEKTTFYKARLLKVIEKSKNRIDDLPKLHYLIGGYELLHMNNKEQREFKIERVKSDFKKIANYEIKNFKITQGEKLLRYRNKITLHKGHFYFPNTNHKIFLKDFLLTDIKIKKEYQNKNELIIRKLDTQIEGETGSKKYTTDNLCNINFRIGLNSFYQVNKEIAESIYKKINKFINKNENILDLYSGIGTISLISSKKAKNVVGVERSSSSIKDALHNKKINKIENVSFVKKDVYKFLKENKDYFDTIIVDPSRKGLDTKIIKLIKLKKPEKIIYLSCNPGTQASNFNQLKDEYHLEYIETFDMFPQTYHIENLIVLKNKKI